MKPAGLEHQFLIFEIVTSFVRKYAYYEEYGTLYLKLQ